MSSINPTPTTIYNIPNDADSNTPRADTSPPHDDVAFTLYSLRASPVNTPPPASPMVTTDQLKDILNSVLNTVKPQSKEDNPFALARLEHYISQGLTLKFDGAQDNLIPWIKKFRALRANAVWREATYLSYEENTYDILSDFTKIKESVIRSQASARWTLPNQAKCLRQDCPELFFPRILGLVVIRSVTDEFYTTLQNYAGVELSKDGPLLLWLILTHFHTSTISYMSKIRSDIRQRSLANHHNHDVASYLIWLRHQVDTLNQTTSDGSTSHHSDLIEPIFQQLLTTKSTRLRRHIEDWHLDYHREEKTLTVLSLIDMTDRTCKALRCTNQLHTDADPELLALQAKLTKQTQLTTQVIRALNESLSKTSAHGKPQPTGAQTGGKHRQNGRPHAGHRPPKPAWYEAPRTDPAQTYEHDGRTWHWCPKCGPDAKGKWVCTHTATTHSDNYDRKRKHAPAPQSHGDSKRGYTNTSTSPAITIAALSQLLQQYHTTAHLAAPPTTEEGTTVPDHMDLDVDDY